ncbi:hypothetical protein AB1N83_007889 [Pleurotus pulmonarius]
MFSLSAVDNCGWPSWCLPATDLNPGAGPPHQSATFNVSGRPQNRLPSHFSDGLSAFGSNYCQEHVLQPTNSDIYHSGVPNDALGADYAVHSLYHDRDSEARTIAISNREPSAFPIQDNESSSTQGPIVRPVVASQATVDAAKKKRRGEAPFACPHCPNSFTTKKNRNWQKGILAVTKSPKSMPCKLSQKELGGLDGIQFTIIYTPVVVSAHNTAIIDLVGTPRTESGVSRG